MKEITKQFKIVHHIPEENGRSRVLIECPFCEFRVWAHLWSLAGSGKKCPVCGAIHRRQGTIKKEKENENTSS